MLKMIIADDEYIVRDGLKTIIPWKDYGIEVVAEAADGQEALDLCLELKPDILFTDIRMPMMDGLEVAMELKERNEPIRIIIISGVQDFNYARTALDVNAGGYVLKPVKIPELKETIEKVVRSINLERSIDSELSSLKRQLHENLPVICEKFIHNWIHGVYRSEAEIAGKLEYLGIPVKTGDSIVLAVLQIDDFEMLSKDMSQEDRHLLTFSISNIMEEIVGSCSAGVCSHLNENEFAVVFNQSALTDNKYMEISGQISDCIKNYLNVTASIGIGRPAESILYAVSSYRDAVTALQYGFYTGKNSILNITDILSDCEDGALDKGLRYSDIYDAENRIITNMKLGDTDKTESGIEELFSHFSSVKNPPVDYIHNICSEMVHIASRAVFELNEDFDGIAGNRVKLIDTIERTGNIHDLRSFMKTTFGKAADYFSNKYSQKNIRVISRIKEIIERKYNENIGVSTISDEISLTPNYISLIFRQGTGETITEYITGYRMEKAKELLRKTDVKILEVAEMVGFENPHYFSTVFKKYTGIHPQKYRTNTGTPDIQ